MKFRLIYVAAAEDGSPTDHAVLRYEPLYGGNYLVDAQTGDVYKRQPPDGAQASGRPHVPYTRRESALCPQMRGR